MRDKSKEKSAAEAAALLRHVAALRRAVATSAGRTLRLWRPAIRRAEFLEAALNLAHYLALRRHDLTALQARLSALGLSSLGRSEGRVLPALDALLATLSRIANTAPRPYPSAAEHRRSMLSIERRKRDLFGPDPRGPGTRIMATLPAEAGADPSLVRRLVDAGADCVRINCAHDDAGLWRAMIRNVRAANRATGRKCRVLMDLAGPKCRLAEISPTPGIRVFVGQTIEIGERLGRGRKGRPAVTVSHPEVLPMLKRGAGLWINDGKIGAVVERVRRGGGVEIAARVVQASPKGARLRPGKGVNFPDTYVTIAPLTKKDLGDLDFVAAEADMVGFSFVQSPADVAWLQRELSRRRAGRPPMPIVIKIETREAVRNLPELVVQGAGGNPLAVMIARGDLAVELGFAELSEMQEQILWICEAAHVPVIWATQVLEGMVRKGLPSRAETTDAAMAQRAECVMLNKGPWLAEGVRLLDQVLHRMDRHQAKKSPRLEALTLWRRPRALRAARAPARLRRHH